MAAGALAPTREAELLHEVADAVGSLMEFWGFKRIMGRIWSLLYLRDEPLSAAELCEELAISTGAASMTLSELEHWGVVKRSRPPGDRREYFEAETDIWRMVSRVLRERELLQIERALETFDRVREQLVRTAAPGDRSRLDEIAERILRLADLARLGRGLLAAAVAQGKVDLGPLMKFARIRRG
jgi:DNA-binding transcriptional regulator GbsR (MarR family)